MKKTYNKGKRKHFVLKMTRVMNWLVHLSANVVITCRKMTWRKHTKTNMKKAYEKILMGYGKRLGELDINEGT